VKEKRNGPGGKEKKNLEKEEEESEK